MDHDTEADLRTAERVVGGLPGHPHALRDLLMTMRVNGALNEGEYRALLGAERDDIVEAVWEARDAGFRDGVESRRRTKK